jgi:hypothetical protein
VIRPLLADAPPEAPWGWLLEHRLRRTDRARGLEHDPPTGAVRIRIPFHHRLLAIGGSEFRRD